MRKQAGPAREGPAPFAKNPTFLTSALVSSPDADVQSAWSQFQSSAASFASPKKTFLHLRVSCLDVSSWTDLAGADSFNTIFSSIAELDADVCVLHSSGGDQRPGLLKHAPDLQTIRDMLCMTGQFADVALPDGAFGRTMVASKLPFSAEPKTTETARSTHTVVGVQWQDASVIVHSLLSHAASSSPPSPFSSLGEEDKSACEEVAACLASIMASASDDDALTTAFPTDALADGAAAESKPSQSQTQTTVVCLTCPLAYFSEDYCRKPAPAPAPAPASGKGGKVFRGGSSGGVSARSAAGPAGRTPPPAAPSFDDKGAQDAVRARYFPTLSAGDSGGGGGSGGGGAVVNLVRKHFDDPWQTLPSAYVCCTSWRGTRDTRVLLLPKQRGPGVKSGSIKAARAYTVRKDCGCHSSPVVVDLQSAAALKNVEFYRGLRRLDVRREDGLAKSTSKCVTPFIDELHATWGGDYELLERHHGYIQWLFPIATHGLNPEAQPMLPDEAAVFLLRPGEPQIHARVQRSVEMMLDFYGCRLLEGVQLEKAVGDQSSGKLFSMCSDIDGGVHTVARCESNWQTRYTTLNRSSHNWLRITRILHFLREVGRTDWQAGFCFHLANEICSNGVLERAAGSCRKFWIPTLPEDSLLRPVLNDAMLVFESNSRTTAKGWKKT